MEHQSSFSPLPNLGRSGLLQIQLPTGEETRAAAKLPGDAFGQVNSFSPEPCLA